MAREWNQILVDLCVPKDRFVNMFNMLVTHELEKYEQVVCSRLQPEINWLCNII